MKISPTYNSSDWTELSLTITSPTEDWEKAISIFDNRYSYRFMKQIDALRFNKSREAAIYSGFAIMSINCLLIETLNQFYYGVNNTEKIKEDKEIKHISSIKDSFVDFLTNSKYFTDAFDEENASFFIIIYVVVFFIKPKLKWQQQFILTVNRNQLLKKYQMVKQ